MTPTVPLVIVPGDSRERVMARAPQLAGLSLRRVAWRFGFKPGSPLAIATGLSSPLAMWAMAAYSGTVLMTYLGGWDVRPPAQFMNCLEAMLEQPNRADLGGLHPRPTRVPEPATGPA